MASRREVPRKSVASGWVRVTSHPAWASFSRSSCSSGSYMAMAWATSRSTITGPQVPRSASCSSTQIAAVLDRRWVWRATRRACQAGTSNRPTRFQRRGRRWRRSRASAISCAPADGDMPNANANGSGVNAATAGVPSPPSDSSASSAAPPNVSTPVSAVAGWRSAQCAASWSLRNAARRSVSFGLGGGFEHADRGRGRRPRTPPGPWCSWDQAKHRPPTLEGLRTPCPQGESRS